MLNKKIAMILILLIFMTVLTGCSSNNIDRLTYAIAIGIDVGSNDEMKLSLQFSIPSNSSSNSSSSSQSSEATIYSVECSDFNDGINLLNNYVSKKINLSHTRVVVFSEEFAVGGISDTIYTLINSVQIRPTANIIVSKCSAREFLDGAKSELEKLSARYYESIPVSSEYTGYTENISISKFFYDLQNTRKTASAILGAINNSSTHTNSNSKQESGTYYAGQTPIKTESSGIENTGIAVFNGDKLIGELNNIETICHLMCTDNLKYCNVTIPNPLGVSDTIDLRLSSRSNVKKNINIVNGNPYIELEFDINCQILSMTAHTDYFSDENLEKIQTKLNQYIERNMINYLYKTSKDLKSDVSGFGQTAIKLFSTWDEWKDYNWLEKYKNSFFNVKVTSNISSGQLLIET